MSDYHRFLLKDIELGLDETPIVLPPVLCAQSVYLNCFSIIGVLVNPEKKYERVDKSDALHLGHNC